MADENSIESIVAEVAKRQNISEYKFVGGDNNFIGDNYFGTLLPVTITGDKNGKEASLSVLIKTPPKNQFLRDKGPVTFMYQREIFAYNKLLPKFERLQEISQEKFVSAECYYVREEVPNEVLVLQDLRAEGFKHSEGMFFDLEHALKTIEATARFHALCIALEKREPLVFEEFRKECFNFYAVADVMGPFLEILRSSLTETAKAIGGNEREVLENLCENSMEHFRNSVAHASLQVIGHNDLWKNNILFKYKDGEPTCAALVDFQTIQVCSPAFDLLYLIATSTDAEFRQTRFEDLLEAYYKEVTIRLKDLSISASEVYSFEDLKKDLKVAGPICAIIASNSFRNWCGLAKETAEYFEGSNPLFKDRDEAKKACVKIVRDILIDFKNLELI